MKKGPRNSGAVELGSRIARIPQLSYYTRARGRRYKLSASVDCHLQISRAEKIGSRWPHGGGAEKKEPLVSAIVWPMSARHAAMFAARAYTPGLRGGSGGSGAARGDRSKTYRGAPSHRPLSLPPVVRLRANRGKKKKTSEARAKKREEKAGEKGRGRETGGEKEREKTTARGESTRRFFRINKGMDEFAPLVARRATFLLRDFGFYAARLVVYFLTRPREVYFDYR